VLVININNINEESKDAFFLFLPLLGSILSNIIAYKKKHLNTLYFSIVPIHIF